MQVIKSSPPFRTSSSAAPGRLCSICCPLASNTFLYFIAIPCSTYASLFHSWIGPVPSRIGLDFCCSTEEFKAFELNQDRTGTDTVANSFDCLKKLLGIITNIRYPQTASVPSASFT